MSGEVAAEQVILALSRTSFFDGDIEDQLRSMVCTVDRSIHEMTKENPDLDGMGSTLTGVVIRGSTAYWVQVGDSRLYLVRGGVTRQITNDQSMLQFLMDEGEITEQQARTHGSRHLLDQCVGQGDCLPEAGREAVGSGDLLMLSSDGLHGALDRQALAELLKLDCSIERKARMLLDAALKNDGSDNITAVLARI